MKRTELRVSYQEAIEGLLNLFVFVEQEFCEWEQLENSIAEIDYDHFSDKYLRWFIDFMGHAIMRIWYSSKEAPMNVVKEVEEGFMVYNYDWNAFLYAMKKGVDPILVRHNVIAINRSLLSNQETKQMQLKAQKLSV